MELNDVGIHPVADSITKVISNQFVRLSSNKYRVVDQTGGSLEEIADCTLCYLPSHYSYMDAPFVKAGITRLHLPSPYGAMASALMSDFIGNLLANAGGFPVDRSISMREQPEYWRSLATFVEGKLVDGDSILFFTGGGRSRDGLIENSQGLGSIFLKPLLNAQLKSDAPIYFVPMAITYDWPLDLEEFNYEFATGQPMPHKAMIPTLLELTEGSIDSIMDWLPVTWESISKVHGPNLSGLSESSYSELSSKAWDEFRKVVPKLLTRYIGIAPAPAGNVYLGVGTPISLAEYQETGSLSRLRDDAHNSIRKSIVVTETMLVAQNVVDSGPMSQDRLVNAITSQSYWMIENGIASSPLLSPGNASQAVNYALGILVNKGVMNVSSSGISISSDFMANYLANVCRERFQIAYRQDFLQTNIA